LQNLFAQAVVEQPRQFLRRMVFRKIGPADIADEERIAGEHGVRRVAAFEIGDDDADAFERMSRRLQKSQTALSERDFIAVAYRVVRKRSARAFTQIDRSAGPFGKFLV